MEAREGPKAGGETSEREDVVELAPAVAPDLALHHLLKLAAAEATRGAQQPALLRYHLLSGSRR